MTGLRIFRILGLVAALLFVSSGISQGAISLRVDGADVTSVTLNPGQSCLIEIYSNISNEYVAYVGFQAADPLGTFDYLYTYPQAGTFAMVNPYNEPPFSFAYEVVAMGDPSPGAHFVFQYVATTPGQVELGLWNLAINKVDSVLITVQEPQGTGACCDEGTGYCFVSEQWDCPFGWRGPGTNCDNCQTPPAPGACCDWGTGACYISEQWSCPYNWLGPWSDCGLCHGQEPTQGACCNQDTGECYMTDEGYCQNSYTWLGYGTSCGSCTPSVEVKRFEINQCFQKVDGVADQNFVLIETKPFVVRVILKATTPEAKSFNIRLKVEKIGEKEPERPPNPIKIAPKTDPQIDPCAVCDFFFLYTDTQNMKAGTYKFSLVIKDSDAEIWSHTYQFKSSKKFKILVVPQLSFGLWRSGYWDDRYISFLEQVYPVPYRDAKNVNHLEIEKGVPLFVGGAPSDDDLFRILNTHLNNWNANPERNSKPGFVPADRICAVVPPGTVLGDALGMAWGNAAIITEGARADRTLSHEIGHTPVTVVPVASIYLGEEYIDSNQQDLNSLWILRQWFRFDRNPPPLELASPFIFIIAPNSTLPYHDQRCKWDPDRNSHAPQEGIVTYRSCDGRYVVPDKAGYDVIGKSEKRFYPSRPADNTLTMMSKNSGSNWISGPEYKSLITLLAPPAPAPLSETAATSTSGERMLVNGIIDIPAKTAEISPLIPVPNLELSEEAADPNCRLVFKSSTGTVLADFNFAPLVGEDPDSILKGPFSVVVDLPDDTARIQVTIEGEVADELYLTDNSPIVTVLSPNGGEQISGEMAITWSASDADINDANNLRYIVEFSHDNGTEWSAIVIDHNNDELTIDSNYLPGGPNCLVKVIASDGWNRSEDTSNAPFTIPTKPPRVTILDPEDGTILLDSESMQGRCTAYDLETGDVNDPNAIVWSSSIDGFLGKGNLIGFQLSVGEHILSATATDPEAKTGIDTVSVKVLANASDFNCDLCVSFLDLARFAENWQASCPPPNWCEGTDIDRNGIVDYDDLAELVENWLWQGD